MKLKKKVAVYMASTVGAAAIVVPGAVILGSYAGAVAAPQTTAVVHLSHDPMHTQANHLTGRVLKHGANAKAVTTVQAFSDGCNHNYGTPTQCVPLRAPGDKPVTCSYLQAAGYLNGGLVVHRDSLNLLATGKHTGALLTGC